MHLSKLFNRRLASAVLVACATLSPVGVASATAPSGRYAVAPATSTPACSTADLVVWLDTHGSGTAGGEYFDLEFTNVSGHTCTIDGYPGVSAVNLSGAQLGSAALWNPAHAPNAITRPSAAHAAGLPPVGISDSATVVLRVGDVGAYSPSSCRPATAAGLRVYPPNQTKAKLVPFPFVACSHAGPHYLSVEAAQKGMSA